MDAFPPQAKKTRPANEEERKRRGDKKDSSHHRETAIGDFRKNLPRHREEGERTQGKKKGKFSGLRSPLGALIKSKRKGIIK